MDNLNKKELDTKCRRIRYLIMDQIGKLGVGHVGGSLSAVEALVVTYYKHMRIDPKNPKKDGRDRFVLSKGHAGPALYAVLADLGYFPLEWLDTLNKPGTRLPSHADMNLTPGVDMTTGSLGQGFSCAVGVALGSKIRNDGAYVYTMIGDGESDEGLIWEAAMLANHKKLNRLVAFTDCNHMQLDGPTDKINTLGLLEEKWKSFGWFVQCVDGHDVEVIDEAIKKAKEQEEKPSMIILDTLKGKGVSFAEELHLNNHSMPISAEQHKKALEELKGDANHV